ncbi:MAG: hypothetical protein HY881_17430 [Deltaproteobacteria bacterium]|nr:hypothetical protein [Deltaproteobacteria bacterium]
MRLRIRKIAAYAGCFLALTGIWGVFLFPSDELIRLAQCGVSQIAPDATLSIGRLGLSLPPGLLMENIALSLPKNKSAVQADQIRVLPKLVSLFQDRKQHSLSARLMIAEIRMELPLPVIGSFQFNQIQADIDWKGEKLDILSLTADGVQMDGSLSGGIEVKTPFENSRLQITGVVHLKPETLARLKASFLGGGIPGPKTDGNGQNNFWPFQITGTLVAPLISLK